MLFDVRSIYIYTYILLYIPLINLRQPVVNQWSPCRDGWWAAPWIQVPPVPLMQARSNNQRSSRGKIIRPWVTSHHPMSPKFINQNQSTSNCLVAWNMFFFLMTFHILGMSSSQLTNSFWSEGCNHQTRIIYIYIDIIYIHINVLFFDLTKILGKQSKQWETGDG